LSWRIKAVALSGIVRESVFFVFQNPKRDFLRFLKCHVEKGKNVESVMQVSFQSPAVFTLLHFEIADTCAVKQLHTCHNIILKLLIDDYAYGLGNCVKENKSD